MLVLALAVIVSYNRFVRQRNLVQESWRQIDVELTRRHELIPNLVETVKGYAAHERTVLSNVVEARNAAVAATGSVPAQAAAETALTGSLRGLLAVAEAYPDLKAAGPVPATCRPSSSETEDRIAAGRRFYNGNVRAMNTRVEAFPSSIVAGVVQLRAGRLLRDRGPRGPRARGRLLRRRRPAGPARSACDPRPTTPTRLTGRPCLHGLGEARDRGPGPERASVRRALAVARRRTAVCPSGAP